jgi:mRNA interferase HigB
LLIVGKEQIVAFAVRHPQARAPLEDWLDQTGSHVWKSIIDVKRMNSSTDGGVKKVYTVFNIKGNSYRLITKIDYKVQAIKIIEVLTHAEYTKWSKL